MRELQTHRHSGSNQKSPQRLGALSLAGQHVQHDPRLAAQQHEWQDDQRAQQVAVVRQIQRAAHDGQRPLDDNRMHSSRHGRRDAEGNSEKRRVDILRRDAEHETDADDGDGAERGLGGMGFEEPPREEDGEGQDQSSGDLLLGRRVSLAALGMRAAWREQTNVERRVDEFCGSRRNVLASMSAAGFGDDDRTEAVCIESKSENVAGDERPQTLAHGRLHSWELHVTCEFRARPKVESKCSTSEWQRTRTEDSA
jgi:hypothetical protein